MWEKHNIITNLIFCYACTFFVRRKEKIRRSNNNGIKLHSFHFCVSNCFYLQYDCVWVRCFDCVCDTDNLCAYKNKRSRTNYGFYIKVLCACKFSGALNSIPLWVITFNYILKNLVNFHNFNLNSFQ